MTLILETVLLKIQKQFIFTFQKQYYNFPFWITLFRWVLKKLYPFESYPVSGDLRGFRGLFRPNHSELAILQDTILFVSSRTTIFVFESLDFVEYWQSYERLKFVQLSGQNPAFPSF